METLTKSGWNKKLDIELILNQIRFAIIDGDARIDFSNTSDYTEEEAKIAFDRSGFFLFFNF